MAFGPDEYDDADQLHCPHCKGPGVKMGDMGSLSHYRCRDCGGQWSMHNETFKGWGGGKKKEEDASDDKKPELPKAEVVSIGTPKEKPVKNSAASPVPVKPTPKPVPPVKPPVPPAAKPVNAVAKAKLSTFP